MIGQRELYEKKKRLNESPEARENRLTRQREYKRKNRANESPELREKRLANQRKYRKKKIANESAECREKRLGHQREYQKEKTRNEPLDCREKRLANRRECVKKKIANTTVADEVRKFHATASEGPMYISSCCDQLWCKHSITAAKKLRLSNPSVIKYLLGKLSEDDMKWLC